MLRRLEPDIQIKFLTSKDGGRDWTKVFFAEVSPSCESASKTQIGAVAVAQVLEHKLSMYEALA